MMLRGNILLPTYESTTYAHNLTLPTIYLDNNTVV